MTRFTRKALPGAIDPESGSQRVSGCPSTRQAAANHGMLRHFEHLSSTHIVASTVRFRDGMPDRANYRRYRIRGTPTQDDFASMAEVVKGGIPASCAKNRETKEQSLARESESVDYSPEFSQESPSESLRTLSEINRTPASPPGPDRRRWGRGRLPARAGTSASRAFDQPIIGLAKEFEEIYRPGQPLPLRLPEDSAR